ncbi:Mandelate racemase/muconate lactonizing enzyme [Pseudooceanicola batsensis HTCC2597]|uniref:Mandelate racemase/muconate lactonizing enzyme n=1 Tax=Pseudooceanicola batsensis (strain ATCC BAA-863 / DSM 15984 / KCTC 12145 / HTCC2597) TaxID=252305 RepID=A3U0R7_PSEBH|nr:muconate/chloromuconate family cycloisomerase [Pseudooceanicola batsensis]EAQ02358.1 Mandelate racemase/muconate lactonizing enzyme [Pseudooceanicola batsensis HTCC2597]
MPTPPTAAVIEIAKDAQRDTRIDAIETRIVDCITTRRHKLSNTEITHQSYVIVEAKLASGAVGYGEASTLGGPRWSEESVEAIRANIDTYIAPVLIGQPALAFEANAMRMKKAVSRNSSARAAVESALYDAAGKTLDLPAAAFLGGQVRDRTEVLWALASGDAEQEIEEARAKLAAREHRRFKIKLGFHSPAEDMVRLRRIMSAMPDGTEMVVDVNQGWSEATAIRYLPELAELGVALIEQPLHPGQLAATARIAARSAIPIMTDEAAFTNQELVQNATAASGSVYSLKLVKSGGLQELKRAAGIAGAFGMELYGGCLLESGIGAAAHMAVFSTLPTLEWGCEHFGPRILKTDLTSAGLVYEDFHILMPSGPGLGIAVDRDVLRDATRKA